MSDSISGSQPLVSVISPTWRRPKLLLEQCIPSVRAQTYQPIEHLIVSDGPDPALWQRINALPQIRLHPASQPVSSLRYVECGQNHGGVGYEPRAAGAWLAAGDWICYLDDDNTYLPGHIEAMMAEAQRASVPLVCTAWRMPDGSTWGWTPPGINRTDGSSFLHHRDLLKVASWQPADGYAADGALIERWLAAGVGWSFLPEPSMVYGGARGGAPE